MFPRHTVICRMIPIKNKKFGRSGGFKRKQKKLVKELVEKYPVSVESVIREVAEIPAVDNNETIVRSRSKENNIGDEDNNSCVIDSDVENGNEFEDSTFINNNDDCSTGNVIEVDNIVHGSEKRSERDFAFDKSEFQSVLAKWAVNCGIKHDQLRGFLKIWNDYVPLPALPLDPRTILETPRTISIKDDNYWHRGLEDALHTMLQTCPNLPDDLSLKINTDGITILKSSGVECWPILIEIAELPKISPEVVGVYCGAGKPKNLESYLREFVNELNDCMTNGFFLNGRKLNVKVNCIIADSPARALLKSMLMLYETRQKS